MYFKTPAITLSEKFKIVIFLAGESNIRHIKLAEQIKKECDLTFISSDKNYSGILNKKNINFYHFRGIPDRWSNLTYEFYCFRLAQYIGSSKKKRNIADNEVLFILNDLYFASILSYFPQARVHFDCTKEINDDGMLVAYKNKLFTKIKTSTVSNMELLKSLELIIKPVFKLSNGIDKSIIEKHLSIPDRKKKRSEHVIGCYCPYPELLDYDFAREIAHNYPQHSFIFLSDKEFNYSKELFHNLKFIKTDKSEYIFDLILFPLKDEQPDKLIETLYLNLQYSQPIVSIENKEFKPYKTILKLCKNKEELIASIADNRGKLDSNRSEKEMLIQQISWESRFRMLESLILAYQ